MDVEPLHTPREPLSKRLVMTQLATGARIGNYVIEKPLGAGGMGQVYLALDERLGRRVALKILPPDDADDEARARFLREAKALARCEHQNVVRVFASGEDNETVWMALEVVDGEPLSALADEPLDEFTAVALMAQVARGLAAVHAVGVVHRDVKPENLLLNEDEVVKIVDFGVALLADAGRGGFTTRKGVVVGTPHFMSPEQARGGAIDARSDAWSLGATLYALLTARPPFFGKNDEADLDILARVLRDPVPDVKVLAPSTSAATVHLLQKLLVRDPALRLSDLALVADQLDAVTAALLRCDTTPAPPAEPAKTVSAASPVTDIASDDRKALHTSPRWGVVVALLLLVVGAVVGGVALGRRFIEPEIQIVQVPVEVPIEVPVQLPVDVVALSPRSPPVAVEETQTSATLAAAVFDAHPSDVPSLLTGLLERDDERAREALALIASSPSPAGDLLLARIDADHRGDLPAVLEAGLFSSSKQRALRVVYVLDLRRDDVALSQLRRAAEIHPDKDVRKAAAAARDSIFKVSD